MAKDYWGWANSDKDKVGAPMAASVQPSNEQAPAAYIKPTDPVDAQLTGMALGKGIEATASGISTGIQAATAAPLAPMAVQGASVAPALAGQAGITSALAGSGVGSAAAASSLAPTALSASLGSAGIAGGTVAGGTLATGAATTGAAAGLGAGGTAAMAALGPVGWTIGGLMLAKKFGLF